MSQTHINGTFAGEMRSLVQTARALAAYASGDGDLRWSQILGNVADILEAAVQPAIAALEPRGSSDAPLLFDDVAAAQR